MEDFTVIKDPFDIPRLDYEKLNQMSDAEFASWYLQRMSEYDWGKMGITPECSNCHRTIDSPKDLRRYIGRTLDSKCLSEVLESDPDFETYDDHMKRYWKRVASLDLSAI